MFWNGERRWVLCSNLGAYFLSISMLYQMSPFFQIYAEETCGASTSTVGVIFAALPLFSFLGSLPVGSLINRYGTRTCLSIGLLVLSGSSLAFGLSRSIPMWILCRALQGLATAPIYTSINTNLAQSFTGPGEFARVNSLLEVIANLGFIVSPMLGGALFDWGGFLAPFAISATAHLLFLGLSMRKSPQKAEHSRSNSLLDTASADFGGDSLEADKDMLEICYRKVLFMASIGALIPAMWGGLEPVLAYHFRLTLGNVSTSSVGLLISMSSLPATLVALFVPRLTELWTDSNVVILGLFLFGMAVALLAVNSSVWSGFVPGSTILWTVQVFALLVCGLGWGLSWTPLLASMVDDAATRVAAQHSVSHSVASTMVSSAVASLFNAAAAIGEASGPTVGGAMVSVLGFESTCHVIAVLSFGICVLSKFCTVSEYHSASPPATPRSAGNAKQFRLCSAVGRVRKESVASTHS